MDAKTIIAVVLSVGIILAYTLIFSPKEEMVPTQRQGQQQSVFDRRPEQRSHNEPLHLSPVIAVPNCGAVESELEGIQNDLIRRDTEVFEIGFSRTGGNISSLRLKEHVDFSGDPVELVHRPGDGTEYFSITFGDWQTETSEDPFIFREIDASTWEFSCDFLAKDGTPFRLIKTYRFDQPDRKVARHLFEIEVRIENSINAKPVLDFDSFSSSGLGNKISYTLGISPQLGPDYESLKDIRAEYREYMRYYPDNKRKRLRARDMEIEPDRVRWTGIVGKYFTLVVVPDETDYTITYDSRSDADIERRTALFFSRPSITSAAETDVYRIYAGPKQNSELKSYNDPNLKSTDWLRLDQTVRTAAIIRWLANVVRFGLDTFYRLIPNYGVAIILLTLVIKILFFPLTRKSSESTKRMAQLQPQIEELRNKFKGKPERLNQATMELYKREKVNPIGGCLPMLLQMPIFFALYTVLMEHFDLRGAAFIVPWISDLSAPERFLPLGFELPLLGWSDLRLLPFLMLGTTFLQTKIMPTAQTGSANQMRMLTYAMPVVFFFILYNLASGLVLYWTVQNILTVVQQLYINSQRDDRGGPSSKNALVNKKRPT